MAFLLISDYQYQRFMKTKFFIWRDTTQVQTSLAVKKDKVTHSDKKRETKSLGRSRDNEKLSPRRYFIKLLCFDFFT